MPEAINITGGCLCGANRFSSHAAPFAADYCHCSMCRNSTGAPVSAWMDFKSEQLVWERKDCLSEYASSEDIRRGFCNKCGSTLTFRSEKHPQYLSLAIASLDDASQVKPTYHIYTEDQLAWFEVSDDCKRYPQGQS